MRKKSSPLDPLMEGYLEYLETVQRRAAGTIKDVRCTLRGVSVAMAERHPEKPLWELKLTDFIAWLEHERRRGFQVSGLCKKVSHLRGFLNYAWRSGRTDRNVMADFYPEYRCPKKEPESLTVEEAIRLVQACPSATACERRDRVMILLLYGCGLRTSEVCTLSIRDVDVERRELHIKKAKGDIERIVPIPDVVFTELLAYLHERKRRTGHLFLTETKRRPISGRLPVTVVRTAAARAGITRNVTPKTLRHSFATHLMDRGVDLAIISKLMGHSTPSETGVYLHVLANRQRAAVDRLLPEGEETA